MKGANRREEKLLKSNTMLDEAEVSFNHQEEVFEHPKRDKLVNG